MSLDLYLTRTETREVTDEESFNITHNLGAMADAAGVYAVLWRPEENNIITAAQMIAPLEQGLARLKADPDHFAQFNATNGWGLYENFVPFVERVLAACRAMPDATVRACR